MAILIYNYYEAIVHSVRVQSDGLENLLLSNSNPMLHSDVILRNFML